MASRRRKSVEELSKEKLPQPIDEAVAKIELIVENKNFRLIHIRITKDKLEVVFSWGLVTAFLAGIFRHPA